MSTSHFFQRKMVRMKETLYGRPFTSFEGGRDFAVPDRALLNDDHILRVSANVRAFACVPAVIDAGMRKALARIALDKNKQEEVVEETPATGDVRYVAAGQREDNKVDTSLAPIRNDGIEPTRSNIKESNQDSESNSKEILELMEPHVPNITTTEEEENPMAEKGKGLNHQSLVLLSFDDFEEDNRDCFIPGRIATSRWIDFSKGRPPDMGYNSCV